MSTKWHRRRLIAYYLVRVHDRLQAMGDGDDRDVLRELRAQRVLYDRIGFVVWKASYTQFKGTPVAEKVLLTNGRRSW